MPQHYSFLRHPAQYGAYLKGASCSSLIALVCLVCWTKTDLKTGAYLVWTDAIERHIKKTKELGGCLNPLVEIPTRLRQFSQQFIRCFRANFMANALWEHCVPQFQRAMAAYL